MRYRPWRPSAGILDGTGIVIHCDEHHAPIGYLVVAPAQLPLADLREDDLEVKRIYDYDDLILGWDLTVDAT